VKAIVFLICGLCWILGFYLYRDIALAVMLICAIMSVVAAVWIRYRHGAKVPGAARTSGALQIRPMAEAASGHPASAAVVPMLQGQRKTKASNNRPS
jgi:hypothetical protein